MATKIIYKVTCEPTGEVYVGATTKSLEERRQDHEQKAEKGTGHYFHQAIATFSPEAFTWEQIDTADNANELAEKERAYVLKYSSNTSGFNQDRAGGFQKEIYQYSTSDGLLNGVYHSLDEAAKVVEAKKTSISNACLGYNRTCKGYFWSYQKAERYNEIPDKRKKPVVQLTLDGHMVANYKSVAEASRKSGLSKTCIARVCRGERPQSGGYRWKYENKLNDVEILNKRNYGE
ncbi:NUMOD1 domain-containing DNA-binding protein [Eudoraea adriatica]|uniref:NUMOD1 domain-containing DNA-binding protein n=1 Tax=Eudoraea adriatica TaxID=446681 RepID=UPI000367FC55|nr:NUMOD1 domain-containing DNA-binding protein [Eudoraea adriatica]